MPETQTTPRPKPSTTTPKVAAALPQNLDPDVLAELEADANDAETKAAVASKAPERDPVVVQASTAPAVDPTLLAQLGPIGDLLKQLLAQNQALASQVLQLQIGAAAQPGSADYIYTPPHRPSDGIREEMEMLRCGHWPKNYAAEGFPRRTPQDPALSSDDARIEYARRIRLEHDKQQNGQQYTRLWD